MRVSVALSCAANTQTPELTAGVAPQDPAYRGRSSPWQHLPAPGPGQVSKAHIFVMYL